MRYGKKGDLALSTNAIVVLIIAVIILGLIITFVTQGFSAVSNKFFGQVNALPDPTAPSSSSPITTSQVVVTGAGKQFGLKIDVLNVGTDTTAATFTPTVTCPSGVLSSNPSDVQVNGQAIDVQTYATFVYIGKTDPAATSEQHLCQIQAALPGKTVTQDLIIQVQ